jgi:hypothetical protein
MSSLNLLSGSLEKAAVQPLAVHLLSRKIVLICFGRYSEDLSLKKLNDLL